MPQLRQVCQAGTREAPALNGKLNGAGGTITLTPLPSLHLAPATQGECTEIVFGGTTVSTTVNDGTGRVPNGLGKPVGTASVAAIRHLVPPPAPVAPEKPGQFSWSDPARVQRILDGAGFTNVVLTPLDLSFNLGADATEAAEFVTFIGQGARLLHGVPDETRQAAVVAFREFFKHHEGPNGVTLSGALCLVSARA